MKISILLLVCAITFISCAKKNYSNSKTKLSDRSVTSLVRSSNSVSNIIDKTISVKTKRFDTSFVTGGSMLIGKINARTFNNKYYENNDLRLDLAADTSGFVTATVLSKLKPIQVKVLETTTTYNDILKRNKDRSSSELTSQKKIDSLSRFETKQVDPPFISDLLNKATRTILIMLLVAGLAFYTFKKVKNESL